MKLTAIRQAIARRFALRLRRSIRAGGALAVGVATLGGGLMFAGTARAIEGVTNGSFENASPEGWAPGFGTYNHATQVYYEGPAPAGAGSLYGWDPGIDPNGSAAVQVVNLAQGGSQIDAGTAAYDFSAWLSSWTGDTDYALVTLEWNDSTSGSGNSVGSIITFDGNDGASPSIVGSADSNGMPDAGVSWPQDNWTFYQSLGTIPVGARSAVITWDGESVENNGNDAYLDLVSLDVPFDTAIPFLELVVNRDDGTMSIANNTGQAQPIKGYTTSSTDGALIYDNWLSVEDNYDASGDGSVDAGEWVEFSPVGATADLSEGALDTGTIGQAASVALSNANGTWLKYFKEAGDDIVFQYIDGAGVVQNGIVQFSGATQTTPYPQGDLNFDGVINGQDWLTYVAGLGTFSPGFSVAQSYRQGDLTGDLVNDHADFLVFKSLFEAANGAGSFAAMLARVPEPSSCLLLAVAGGSFLFCRRRPQG